MGKAEELLLQLVQIDSPSGQEELMGQYLSNWLKEHNFLVKRDNTGNIYATNNLPGEPILFCCHMDTVEPGKGIKPKSLGGVICSDGKTVLGADNKAAIAALLTAADNDIRLGKKIKALELLFTVKEETDGGIRTFPFEWLKSKKGIVIDYAKPLGGIVLRSPYIQNFSVTLFGKATHSSDPDKGKNALTAAVSGLSKITVGKTDNGNTTINVGKIYGGSAVNTVPAEIILDGEVRSYNKDLLEKNINGIESIFKNEAEKKGIGVNYSLSGCFPGYEHTSSDLFVKQVKSIYEKLGLKPLEYLNSAVSDANVLNKYGIKTLVLTDGVNEPHTTNESIKTGDLNKLVDIILSLLINKVNFR